MRSNCNPNLGATGQVIGLRLDYDSVNTWSYTIIWAYSYVAAGYAICPYIRYHINLFQQEQS
jgi:hypothetical protein